MQLNSYLHFHGNCAEAFAFYEKVFGNPPLMSTTYVDAPDDWPVPPEDKNKIMHISLPVGENILMGCDAIGPFAESTKPGNNISISINLSDRAQTETLFAALSEGGNVTMPLADMFWGDYFGSLTDAFGINWMLNCGPKNA